MSKKLTQAEESTTEKGGNNKVKLLTRSDILAKRDLPQEEVDLTPFGLDGSVLVRGMTAGERDAYEISMARRGARAIKNVRARIVSLTVIDEDGKRLFSEKDIDELGKLSAAPLDRLFGVGLRLSGINQINTPAAVLEDVQDPSDSEDDD